MVTPCGKILLSRTDDDLLSPSPPTCARMSVQNVSVYAGITRTCVSTCARGAGTHGNVLSTRRFSRCHTTHTTPHTTPHTHHNTRHNTTQHDTPQHITATRPQHHTETGTERDRERREDGRGETRQEKRRKKKTRSDKTRIQEK